VGKSIAERPGQLSADRCPAEEPCEREATENGAVAETASRIAGGGEHQKEIEQVWMHER
jgi:hypothetical protein